MPSKRAGAEWLAYEVTQGRGDEPCHIVDIAKDQKTRIENKKRKQNFVLVTGDPNLCAALEKEKDRVFRRVKNKSVAMTLLLRAWEQALADPELDKILAAMEDVPMM